MSEKNELTEDELEELLIRQAEHQPAKCGMKPAAKHIKLDKTALKSEDK